MEAAQTLFEELKKQEFPREEWPVLCELAQICGGQDPAKIWMVCYLYGKKQGTRVQ